MNDYLMKPETESIYGDLPLHWQLVDVGLLVKTGFANLQTGPFGTMLHASAYKTSGTPVVAVQHIGQGRLLHKDLPLIDSDTVERLQRYKLQIGDVLFGRKGAIDRRAIVTESEIGWLQGSDCIRLRLDANAISPFYILYVLGTDICKSWIIRHAQGATMPSLNQEIVSRIPIPLPPLEEQRAIADILGSLDDKIELNHRMNATLEETARALFKSWFVDFDPIRAKMEGREPVGMDAETAALFPDRLVESELGPIPEGWQIRPLDKIGDFLNGLALQKFPADGDNYLPAIKIRELRQGYIDDSSDKVSPNIKPEYIIQDGDVVFSWSGSLLVDIWSGGTGALNQHLFKVTSNQFSKWFYYLWVAYHLEWFQQIAADKATTMGHIQRYHLSSALTIVPPDNVLAFIDMNIHPILDTILLSRQQSRMLVETRDSLLPRLLTGEIRLNETI